MGRQWSVDKLVMILSIFTLSISKCIATLLSSVTFLVSVPSYTPLIKLYVVYSSCEEDEGLGRVGCVGMGVCAAELSLVRQVQKQKTCVLYPDYLFQSSFISPFSFSHRTSGPYSHLLFELKSNNNNNNNPPHSKFSHLHTPIFT
ncbi:hypothetical protein QVD17_27887 [Tagetes erecta]|uniref:Uncharacterized protein n=1 Tax=Tagetes erecta TaxID=13708 RepID=A0AAD8NS68_TARER|nr:hypothetical protein QVD17_27887 [Tagetes erecta]